MIRSNGCLDTPRGNSSAAGSPLESILKGGTVVGHDNDPSAELQAQLRIAPNSQLNNSKHNFTKLSEKLTAHRVFVWYYLVFKKYTR